MIETHVFTGSKDCGCIRAVALDQRNKSTGKQVYDMLANGLIVERVTIEAFDALGGINAVFADCPHEEKQLDMFETVATNAANMNSEQRDVSESGGVL